VTGDEVWSAWPRQPEATLPPRRPHDRLAVASVVLSSLWLWWVGSLVGIVLGLVALIRHRSRPDPRASLRWASAGIALGVLGVATFSLSFGPPIMTSLRHHFEDSAAQASLGDLQQALRKQRPTVAAGYPTSSASVSPWTIVGGTAVEIVGPGTASTGFKKVSVEVWNVSSPSPTGDGDTLYAAVLSGSSVCFYLKDDATPSYSEGTSSRAAPCSADAARSITTWGSDR
jgi:hypothetical protein